MPGEPALWVLAGLQVVGSAVIGWFAMAATTVFTSLPEVLGEDCSANAERGRQLLRAHRVPQGHADIEQWLSELTGETLASPQESTICAD